VKTAPFQNLSSPSGQKADLFSILLERGAGDSSSRRVIEGGEEGGVDVVEFEAQLIQCFIASYVFQHHYNFRICLVHEDYLISL